MAESKIIIQVLLDNQQLQAGSSQTKRVIDQVSGSVTKMGSSVDKANKKIKQNRTDSGLNNAILMETSRLASDVSFGFTAIANNLSQLINLFRASKDATGGYANSIKSLLKFSNLLLIGIQLLITFLPRIIKNLNESKDSANALAEAVAKATASIKTQVLVLSRYQELLNSNNLSLAQKEKLLIKVKKETGLNNLKLDENNKLTKRSNDLIKEKIKIITIEAQINAVRNQIQDLTVKKQKQLNDLEKSQNSTLSKATDFVDRKTQSLQENIGTISRYAKSVISSTGVGLIFNSAIDAGSSLIKKYRQDVNSAEAVQSRQNKTTKEAAEITEEYNKNIQPLIDELNKLIVELFNAENAVGEFDKSIGKLSAISFKDFSNAQEQMRNLTKEFTTELIEDELLRNQTLLSLERDFYLKSIDQSIASEDEKAKARAAVIAFYNREIEMENERHFEASLDAVASAFDKETAIAKAALIMKQVLAAKELLLDIGVLKSKASNEITEATLDLAVAKKDVAAGGASVAKTGNPLAIAAYALTAASIIGNVINAVKKAKTAATEAGGGGGTGVSIEAPDFNVVGASGQSQLAQTIAGAEAQPVRAFVVGKDISTQQELDRNITNTASFG